MMGSPELTDHDLLIVAITKLDALSASFAEVKTAVASKADTSRVEKLEDRLDATRRQVYMILGGLVLIEGLSHIWKI